jgi:peptidoglycan biosynthesis protein MviN/MurJ (putative lipid II flippase)
MMFRFQAREVTPIPIVVLIYQLICKIYFSYFFYSLFSSIFFFIFLSLSPFLSLFLVVFFGWLILYKREEEIKDLFSGVDKIGTENGLVFLWGSVFILVQMKWVNFSKLIHKKCEIFR